MNTIISATPPPSCLYSLSIIFFFQYYKKIREFKKTKIREKLTKVECVCVSLTIFFFFFFCLGVFFNIFGFWFNLRRDSEFRVMFRKRIACVCVKIEWMWFLWVCVKRFFFLSFPIHPAEGKYIHGKTILKNVEIFFKFSANFSKIR
jgi:hypothetical protein